MRSIPNLWRLHFDVPYTFTDLFAELFNEEAVAITTLIPPRQVMGRVEAMYHDEPDSSQISLKLDILSAAVGIGSPAFMLCHVPNLDWLKKVAQDFPPLKIARWTVHGALHRDKVPHRLRALQIDATNAFGTGEHPTTRGCLIVLDVLLRRGFRPRRMADIGCGSGILAMACVQAARGKAIGVDIDADSVCIARHNVRGNGLGRSIRINRGCGYASSTLRACAPYDLIMANIFADPLCRIAKDLQAHLRPGGYAILSGLLRTQAKKVIAVHKMQGLALYKHLTIGEWSVLALHRPNKAI